MDTPFESKSSSNSQENSFSPSTSSSKGPDSDELLVPQESFISEIIKFSLIALLIVLPVRIYIAQPFIVSGASMESTFSTGQYLIVDQLTYRFEEPKRGDVVIFRYPRDPSKYFIKRIIGIPGDTVDIQGNVVTIKNNSNPEGTVLNEEYILAMAPNTTLTEKLGTQEYFVMGDNRNASSDSRSWGVLQRDKIIGRAFVRLFPFSKIDVLPGHFNITTDITSSPPQNTL